MKTRNHQKLFSPVQIAPITLAHRVVMAPLTRSRSLQPGDIPSDLMREYYTQRASEGGFIISEATALWCLPNAGLTPTMKRSNLLFASHDDCPFGDFQSVIH